MAMLGRLARGHASQVLPYYGDPVAAQAARAATAGDLAFLDRLFTDSDLDRRALLIRAVGRHLDPAVSWRWVEVAPQVPNAWQIHASATAGHARSVRGTVRAVNVGAGRTFDFIAGMADARRSLGRVFELRPGDPLALAETVFTDYAAIPDHSTGAPAVEQVRADVRALVAARELATDGLRTAVNLLGDKWFGDEGEALGLARWLSEHAPPGHDVHGLAAFAVVERYIYLRNHQGKPRQASAYVAGTEAREAVATALDRGVRRPEHRPTVLTPRIRNDLAYACRLVKDDVGAAEQFTALNGLATSYPWDQPGISPGTFSASWRAVLR